MTESDAREAVRTRVGESVTARIGVFLDRVIAANAEQNLISPSTIESIWSRHALDSVQLLDLAGSRRGLWIDIGTGGGFPGMVVALAWTGPVLLVEPRRRRATFLEESAAALGLDHVRVLQSKVEAIGRQEAAIISARAVASIGNLLHAGRQCGTPRTRWLLPRGTIDPGELALLQNRRTMFHVEHSITDPASTILVIDGAGA